MRYPLGSFVPRGRKHLLQDLYEYRRNFIFTEIIQHKKVLTSTTGKTFQTMISSLQSISQSALLLLSSFMSLGTTDLTSDLSSLNFTVWVPGTTAYSSEVTACEFNN